MKLSSSGGTGLAFRSISLRHSYSPRLSRGTGTRGGDDHLLVTQPPINIAIACSVDAVQIAKINLGDYGEAETYGYQYLITVTNKGGKWAHVVVQFGVVPMA